MLRLLRLVVAIALGVAAVAGAGILIPLAFRDVYRHGSSTVANPIRPLRTVTLEGSTVYAANGQVLAQLQPERLSKPVRLPQISPVLIQAVLDTEDHRFFQHGGIDFPSMVRALLSDAAGHSFQGGSTLTQQLVKNVYLNSERKISRKIKEAVIANRLQKKYSKRRILDAYLNTIYLGSGAYGVEAASEAYWGVHASQLRLPQAALLAGLIQAPSGYDPVAYPAAARARRAQVLGRMLHYHDITRAQYRQADAAPLPTSVTTHQQQFPRLDGYYVAEVERILLGPGSPLGRTPAERSKALFEGGYKIYTNLQPWAQANAEAAVSKDTPPDATSQGIEENLVSINPATGAVNALIGGQNYVRNQFDPATQGREQAGSGFKLFTLLAGLTRGQSIYDKVDASSPCSVPFPGNLGYTKGNQPGPAHNDEGDGQQGVTTVLNATAQSLNCAYFRMAHQAGLPNVVTEAERLGISPAEIGPYAHDPSIVLGTAGVEPLEMADAYATMANGGTYRRPSFISRIVGRRGRTVYTQPAAGKRVVPPNLVAEADVAFQAVVNNGTGYAAAIPGRPVAGKTGTTNGPTSAWFNGYTPQLETTVWMGDPTGHLQKMVVNGILVYGGTFPAQTVHDYMAAELAHQPVESFPALNAAALPPPEYIPEDSLTDQGTTLTPTRPLDYPTPPTTVPRKTPNPQAPQAPQAPKGPPTTAKHG